MPLIAIFTNIDLTKNFYWGFSVTFYGKTQANLLANPILRSPFLVLLQSDSMLAKLWLTQKPFSAAVQPPALQCLENAPISKDMNGNYVTTMKEMASMMHPSLHQSLQARPPALKDNMSWTSQLLWISMFSPVKEGAFFSYSSVMLRIQNEMMLGKPPITASDPEKEPKKAQLDVTWAIWDPFRIVLPRLQHESESSGGLVKTQPSVLHPQSS